jgi:hypothetical protein
MRLHLALFILLMASSPASAYTFILVGNGSQQNLDWSWEYRTNQGATSCAGSTTAPCGGVYASAGRIPLRDIVALPPDGLETGGMLDWTFSGGVLRVMMMPILRIASSPDLVEQIAEATVDALAAPLDFQLVAEPGDPNPLTVDLMIRPKVSGIVTQSSNDASTFSLLELLMETTVSVNGQIAKHDTLYRRYYEPGAQPPLTFPVTFDPKAIIVPGVPAGSVIQVATLSHVYAQVTTSSAAQVTGPYGNGPAFEIEILDANAVGVGDSAPGRESLVASPNPFGDLTRISYTLTRDTDVRLSIYDLSGQRVATLRNGHQPAGRSEAWWNGTNDRGMPLSPGIYMMELNAGPLRRVKKLVLLRRSGS